MILRLVDWQDLLTLAVGVFLGALAARLCARRAQARQRQLEIPTQDPSSPLTAASGSPRHPEDDAEARWRTRQAQDTTLCFNFGAVWSLFGGSGGRSSSSSREDRGRSQTAPAVPGDPPLRRVPTTRGQPQEMQKQYIEALRRWRRTAQSVGLGRRPRQNLAALLRSASRKELVSADAVWLNQFARLLWPQVAAHIKNVLYDIVEPAINSKLPSFLQGKVHFKDVTLGKNAPSFSDVVVMDNLAKDRIEIRMSVTLNSDLEASLVAMGARVRVANLVMEGEISIVFGPLMPKPPYFGGLEIYFVNPVDLGLQLGGNLIPKGLHPALCSAIAGAVARFMVLPNRIAVDLNAEDDTDRTDIKYQDPIGVLQLTILRAQGLTACDVSLFGNRSSDPYVVVTLGATRWHSPTINQSLNPVWGEDGKGVTVDLPFHSPSQLVKFEVWDADVASSDDLIGTKSQVELGSLIDQGSVAWREVPLQLLDPKGNPTAGTLFVSGRLLQLLEIPRPMHYQPLGGPSGAYLAVKVMEVRGLPSAEVYPYKVRVSVGDIVGTTKGSFVRNDHISYALERVCTEQLQRGQPPKLVARALGLDVHDVEAIGLSLGSPQFTHADVQEAVKKAVGIRAATNPHFEETVQLLIPDPSAKENSSHVRLHLLDKKGNVISSADIAFAEVLKAKELTLAGSILLQPLGADMVGRVRLRFLDL